MKYRWHNIDEYAKRKGVVPIDFNLDIVSMRTPNLLDFLLAYVTMCIPAAMLARVTRKITGRKGTPLENYLMDHYFNMSVKLLRKD